MKKNWGKRLLLKTFLRSLIPILAATAVMACLMFCSVYSVNAYVRDRNAHISQAIASDLAAALERSINESEKIVLAYTSNQEFFRTLTPILNAPRIGYSQLQLLRSLEKSVSITQSIRPYIASTYFCCASENCPRFLVAQDGVHDIASHADGAFIVQACLGLRDGLSFRQINGGTSMAVNVLSMVGRGEGGVVIVNIDCRALQSELNDYAAQQTDGRFLVFDAVGSPRFGSPALIALGQVPVNGRLTVSEGGREVEYLVTAEVSSSRDFTLSLLATEDSIYATRERLIGMNLALITLSLAIGVAIAWIVSSRRYKGYAQADDYMQKLDDLGSRGWKSSGYAAQYTDYENNIRLHLSEHELKERMLELETLRHQLNPHLLLNTLQMLNWRLMRERKGRSDVNDTLEHLCKILAYALKPADSLVSLTEEMRYTDAYMQLQFHEGKQRIEVSWRLGDPELTDRIRVPRVIFQPILENAVKHAFIGIDHPPELAVELRAEAGDILFYVRDNGVGMSPERLEAVRRGMLRSPEDGHGIGLYNTNKRIHLLFGSRYGLNVDSVENRGTTVTILLPRIESGEEDK